MKQIKKITIFFLITVVVFASCKKVKPDTDPTISNNNLPPVARAGPDQIITLPIDSVKLSGSGTDTDGVIVSYSWIKVSGPAQFTFSNSASGVTRVSDLLSGTYQFKLTVTDNSGLSASDTVAVEVNMVGSVPVINTQLIWMRPLSVWRLATTSAAAGGKILFAGGYSMDFWGDIIDVFSRVDIYDINTQIWSTAELSEARYNMSAAVAGNKIVFAGGKTASGSSSGRVDIYDVVSNSWTTAQLSEAREGIAGASVGNKILFAGGFDEWLSLYDRVDIYDVVSNNWTTAHLSEARGGLVGASIGNKILFAGGGEPKRVDIYDASTNAWTTASLSESKNISVATTAGNTVYFANSLGGTTSPSSFYTKRVQKYDAASGNWSVDSLDLFDFLSPTNPIRIVGATTAGNIAVFVPSGIFNFIFYNSATSTWAISSRLSNLFGWESSIVSTNNQVYIAGWEGVWRVQF